MTGATWILDIRDRGEMPGQVGLVLIAPEGAEPGDSGVVQLSIFADDTAEVAS